MSDHLNNVTVQMPHMSILLIDHQDSFTYNIKAWLEEEPGVHVQVIEWEDPLLSPKFCGQFDCIVFSPGPGHPGDYTESLSLMASLPDELPVFGICLGMQMMVFERGGQVVRVEPVHGKSTRIETVENVLFDGIDGAQVGRYHSLAVQNVPESYDAIAHSPEGWIMAIYGCSIKRIGFQFHPESFLTSCNTLLRVNFFKWLLS